jgi:uncharacterized membrane protein
MKTARHELRRFHEKWPKPVPPIWVDVNADRQSIAVSAPVAEVYRSCLRFEDLPRFITSIKKVEKINDRRFSCTSVINGKEVKTVVTVMMRVPDRRIAWQGVSDNFRVGVISFDALAGGATKVTVKVRSIVEPVLLTGVLRNYLTSFKRFVEEDAAK